MTGAEDDQCALTYRKGRLPEDAICECQPALQEPVSALLVARGTVSLWRTGADRCAYLRDGGRIVERRQIAWVAAFGYGLDTAAQHLARAGLRQHRHEVHPRGAPDSAKGIVNQVQHFLFQGRRPSASASLLESFATANATGT